MNKIKYLASTLLLIVMGFMFVACSDSDSDSLINVVRILDDQTLVFYIGYLYEDGASNNEALYTFYAGSIFGNMTYYGTPTYYTYAKVGNKLIVSNGDIYTVTSGGLIKDGSSALWSKYDPKKVTG